MLGHGQAAPEERRDRPRRVNALLNAYYSIEGSAQNAQKEAAKTRVCADLDRQGFDAKRYFDGIVVSGQLPDLVKRSSDLDAEVKELDTEMQKLVYENYTQFTRAATVISRMKLSIEKFEPDMNRLEGSIGRISKFQDQAEEGVSENCHQLEKALKQQRVCRKLDTLFGLPAMLQRCLDQGAYEQAVNAHDCCSKFLAQYKHMPTFQNIHQEVEGSMRSVSEAVARRLQLPTSQVWEAVRDARTLHRLGADLPRVAQEYLAGRSALLQKSLELCFAHEAEATTGSSAGSEAPSESKLDKDTSSPEASMLKLVFAKVTETYVRSLCDAAEGFYDLQDGCAAGGGAEEGLLSDFIGMQLGRLFEQIAEIVERRCPPTRALASCLLSLRDALRPLYARLPRLLPKVFLQLLNSIVSKAMDTLFFNAAAMTISDLSLLHEECMQLESMNDGGLSAVLEEITKTEQGLIMNSLKALTECQPLLGLLDSDQAACQQFVRKLHGHLTAFFLTFVDACHGYVGQDAAEARAAFPSLSALPRPAECELAELAQRDWRGMFGLILVRMGRHLEVKVISKVWGVAKDMFAGSSELTPPPAVIRATRAGAQAVITHYTMVAGQRLAHLIRDSIHSRNWLTGNEPRDPLFLADVIKEMSSWDAQLARILSDPRKEHPDRRSLTRSRNPMELEMERLWAKKLQTFAAVPFNRNGVIVGILRIAFKALYEYVRQVTFGKYGLQQIQVDCAFLTLFVQGFVEAEDAHMLESFLNEAKTSAMVRCDEPELMDTAMLEALCEEKKRELPGLACNPN